MLKVLNLYAGIGGNRKLWENVEVTAVENNQEIAKIYQDFFPNDKVIVADAHQYLLEHYKEFDFIWSSPPCQSHSRLRKCFNFANDKTRKRKEIYPAMELYQEIIFLQHNFKGKWVVENVIPYYEPLINAQEIQRHLFWSNFLIPQIKIKSDNIQFGKRQQWEKSLGLSISKYKIKHRKDQILRNCINPELGKHVFECAFKTKQTILFENQTSKAFK